MDKTYYKEMLSRNRLIPFFTGEKLTFLISFYITNNTDFYIQRDDPWSVENDDDTGSMCYIDQLLTSRSTDNPKLSYEIWRRFKSYIKKAFPTVKEICWRRHKNGITKTYKKEI